MYSQVNQTHRMYACLRYAIQVSNLPGLSAFACLSCTGQSFFPNTNNCFPCHKRAPSNHFFRVVLNHKILRRCGGNRTQERHGLQISGNGISPLWRIWGSAPSQQTRCGLSRCASTSSTCPSTSWICCSASTCAATWTGSPPSSRSRTGAGSTPSSSDS